MTPLDLGAGPVLRRATPADADALAAFNAVIHSDAGPDMPDDRSRVLKLSFYHLLFGYRALDEVRRLYRDCWADGDAARVLLEALFPPQVSDLWPVS